MFVNVVQNEKKYLRYGHGSRRRRMMRAKRWTSTGWHRFRCTTARFLTCFQVRHVFLNNENVERARIFNWFLICSHTENTARINGCDSKREYDIRQRDTLAAFITRCVLAGERCFTWKVWHPFSGHGDGWSRMCRRWTLVMERWWRWQMMSRDWAGWMVGASTTGHQWAAMTSIHSSTWLVSHFEQIRFRCWVCVRHRRGNGQRRNKFKNAETLSIMRLAFLSFSS